LHADILLVTGNPRISLSGLVTVFPCREIIIDSSTPKWKIKKWKTEADQMGVQCYSVDESGIYLRDF
jgi:competence protein ComEC